jgi:DNA modification methylase
MTKIDAFDEASGEGWQIFRGDCVEVMRQLPPAAVDFAVYSPPFSNLYCYSDSERDMGNAVDDAQFLAHYRFMIDELYRAMRPGRLVAVHCKDLVNYKGRDGMAGLRDFPGDLIRAHQDAGFAFHSRVTVWKCPVTEMTRTKAHGLLYKTLRADSTFSRQGLAEYVLVFRRWPANANEEALVRPVPHTTEEFPLKQWQEWASPVWFVDDMDVLNVQQARDSKDEKHMCPLALPIIERCLGLWSLPGDVALSPFLGIGSEGYQAIKMRRRFLGIELKDTYFAHARRHLEEATRLASQGELFASTQTSTSAPTAAAQGEDA